MTDIPKLFEPSTEALFEVPNLDDLSANPADLEMLSRVFHVLGNYAKRKAEAMRLRLSGEVGRATTKEYEANALWDQLPEMYRW